MAAMLPAGNNPRQAQRSSRQQFSVLAPERWLTAAAGFRRDLPLTPRNASCKPSHQMKTLRHFSILGIVILAFGASLCAQTAATESATPVNTAIIPAARPDERARARTDLVLQRAKDNPGPCDIAFIGDSITQGWEGAGKPIWEKYYANRKCLNFGVGGDRTQHVLWRFENGQLDGIKPKAAVLMIGTNNSNREDNTEADILAGVQLIVKQLRERLPQTKVLIVGIFPRGQTFSTQRGKILQVNQALAKFDDGRMIHYLDLGSELIDADGSIPKDLMPDYLHLSERGYGIWAQAMEPKLKELLR
jgi:lysophospholipase L1-like esterase